MIVGYEHAVQISVLFKAVGLGYLLGFLYGFFSFFNSLSKSTAAVFIRDILFFVLNAAISFLFLLKYNAGVIRGYIIAGEVIGFSVYHIFPGALFEGYIRKISARLIPAISEKTDSVKKRALKDIKNGAACLKAAVSQRKSAVGRREKKKEHLKSTARKKSRKFLRKKDKKIIKNT